MKISSTNTFQLPWIAPSTEDHLSETRGRLKRNVRREKRSRLLRISKTGFLCQVFFEGSKMKLIDVIGDGVVGQKMILTQKNTSLKLHYFRILGGLVTFSRENWGQ